MLRAKRRKFLSRNEKNVQRKIPKLAANFYKTLGKQKISGREKLEKGRRR